MLAMLDICEAIETSQTLDPKVSKRQVLGLDLDIRQHNKEAIEAHPMASRIEMIQGSSIAPKVIQQVLQLTKNIRLS
jgi:cephalosporin hydroxylase